MTTSNTDLEHALHRGLRSAEDAFARTSADTTPREVGRITSLGRGVCRVTGLGRVKAEELLSFPGGVYGMAFNIDPDDTGVIPLGGYDHLAAGDEVERTDRVADVPVGDALIGRVIDPTGIPLDNAGPVKTTHRLPVEREARPIMERAPVTTPLQTGIKAVDALIPIGRGQRELILGDRQTGKTAIAVDTILNQQGQNVLCIYCAIGQRSAGIAKVVAELKSRGAMEYTLVVVVEGDDPPGLQFLAPYAATSIAEHFMDQGRDVLVIYDDLTRHAQAYRELSLLLRRPPGREAFPGDIFYIHSRLLERSTHLRPEHGGGSITSLPIIETEAQNMSAYIPTNLISITDGQIALSPDLFQKGVLPAVDVGRSVSRVGGKTQLPAFRAVAGDLRLSYSQFEELEAFSRFGTRLDDATRATLMHGRRVREVLKQPQYQTLSAPEQVAVLLAVSEGLLDQYPLHSIAQAEEVIVKTISEMPEIRDRILSGIPLEQADRDNLLETVRTALETLPKEHHADTGSAEA